MTAPRRDLAPDVIAHERAIAAASHLQVAREEIAAQLREPEPVVAPPTIDVSHLLAGLTPATPAQIRANTFAQVVAPRLRDFGFEARYRVDGLLDGPDPRIAEQRAVLAKIQTRFQGVGAIVALVGPRGTGKTSIAAQLAATWLWEDWEIATRPGRHPVPHRITSYRKLSAIVAKLKGLYGDFGTTQIEQLESIRTHLASVDRLVIDELAEVPDDSKHKDRILTDLLDLRYAKQLDTLLISNQTPANFRDTINPSIASRIAEHGSIIRCEWPSFRTTPATPVQP